MGLLYVYIYTYLFMINYYHLYTIHYYPIDYPNKPYKFIDNESVRNLNYSYQCMLEHLELKYIDMKNYNGSTISFLVNDYSQHIYIYVYIYTIYKS